MTIGRYPPPVNARADIAARAAALQLALWACGLSAAVVLAGAAVLFSQVMKRSQFALASSLEL